MSGPMHSRVVAVARDAEHRFSKQLVPEIEVVAGLGVRGDAHNGATVQHLSRVKADPAQPNLRQVHLIHAELFDELAGKGFTVGPADLGENVTTRGIDLLGLPRGTVLSIGDSVRLELSGLRNPCRQIDRFQKGLLAAVLDKGPNGEVIRKSGVMAIAIAGGTIRAGDPIEAEMPKAPFMPLERV